jgi:AraC family transcriptional regulator
MLKDETTVPVTVERKHSMYLQPVPDDIRPQPPIAGDISLLRAALAKSLHDASGAVERDTGIGQACIAEALALLKREGVPADRHAPTPRRCGLAPWQERSIKSHIEDYLDGPIKVADLAALSRLSVSYFSRAFRRSYGYTVQTFLAERRVERAQMLMVSTDESLSRIALACGFYDQAHLCRTFRRLTRTTPGCWRREHVNSTGNPSRAAIRRGAAAAT